jgi:hypothetical protein
VGRIHVIVITHTTRHLRRTLLGVAAQTRRADSVTVSIDGSLAEIRQLVADVCDETGLSIALVEREHQGVCRSAQVRNNGARAVIDSGAAPDDLLVFYDGDCCPAPDALATYHRLVFGVDGRDHQGDIVVGHWIALTPEQTEAFDEAALKRGDWPARIDPSILSRLGARRRRYKRQLLFKRLGLGKPHKPKVASGNFGVLVDFFQRVNGFDELYDGYGQEDDDFGRRVYRAGGRPIIGVDRVLVFHQWHPTRQPDAWATAPGVKRFKRPFQTRCLHGLDNPVAQPTPSVTLLAPRVHAGQGA